MASFKLETRSSCANDLWKPKEGNETQITILIKDYPNRDASGQIIETRTVEEGFKQQIFNKIEMFVGYPMNKDDESDSD